MASKIVDKKGRTEESAIKDELDCFIPYDEVSYSHKEFFIKSKLGHKINTRFYPAQQKTDKVCILLHGYASNSIKCSKYAKYFNELGFDCYAPDMRYCGKTGGKYSTLGVLEKKDVESLIDYIYSINKKANIGLFGISMGAGIANTIASERNDIKFVVSYCAFSSFKDILMAKSNLSNKSFKFFYPTIVLGCYFKTKCRMDYVNIENAVEMINCPLLIMHSQKDDFTPYNQSIKLKSKNDKASFVSFENSRHAKSYAKYPEKFKNSIKLFLKDNNLI